MAFLNRTVRTAALLLAFTAAAAAQDPIASPPPNIHWDTFGDLPLRDMSRQLDNLAIALKNSPEDRLVFILYGGRLGCRGHAMWRGGTWKNYLVKRHGIAPERVVLIDGGYRHDFTAEFYLVPSQVREQPPPIPTVDPTEVRFLRGDSRRCRNRRR
jgi:hypothetical protein